MSTPKPGQIRCPTCLRSTPPAAYCTQCGSPIPQSARARPRGLDRDELEERIRRQPGRGGFRRGAPIEDAPERAGYVPFEPEPEDALAKRDEQEAPHWADGDLPEQQTRRVIRPDQEPGDEGRTPPPAPAYVPPAEEPGSEEAPAAYAEPEYPAEAYDERPYGAPEDAYAYPYAVEERRGGGGGSALPIIGFVVLCVLALAVGAVLAGLLEGDGGVGQPSPSASVQATDQPSTAPSDEPPTQEPAESEPAATPDPTGGPVVFDDGAIYSVQPCGTYEYRQQAVGQPNEAACVVDGSTRDSGNVWILIVFDEGRGNDNLTLALRQDGSTIDQQETVLGSIVGCEPTCDGLIWGAIYQELDPGEYELVLRRDGDFADSAPLIVEG